MPASCSRKRSDPDRSSACCRSWEAWRSSRVLGRRPGRSSQRPRGVPGRGAAAQRRDKLAPRRRAGSCAEEGAMQGRVKTAVVTGASSGIGLELCRLLARDGARVVMVARDAERLQRAARWIQAEHPATALTLFPTDLSRAGSAAALGARLEREVDPADLLVNSAGAGSSGPFAHSDLAREMSLVQLNVMSLVELTHVVAGGMLRRGSGRILNVASAAGFLPGPMM